MQRGPSLRYDASARWKGSSEASGMFVPGGDRHTADNLSMLMRVGMCWSSRLLFTDAMPSNSSIGADRAGSHRPWSISVSMDLWVGIMAESVGKNPSSIQHVKLLTAGIPTDRLDDGDRKKNCTRFLMEHPAHGRLRCQASHPPPCHFYV